MQSNLFSIPKGQITIYLSLILIFSYSLCFVLFPIILNDYYGESLPSYVMLDTIIVSRDVFWFFESIVFFINLWIFSWNIKMPWRYSIMIFNFIIGWLVTILDFRYPSIGIVVGTGFMCAFYYFIIPFIKLFIPQNEVN